MYIKENDQFTESDTINQFFTDNEPRMCCECGSQNIENGECQDCKVNNIFGTISFIVASLILIPFVIYISDAIDFDYRQMERIDRYWERLEGNSNSIY